MKQLDKFKQNRREQAEKQKISLLEKQNQENQENCKVQIKFPICDTNILQLQKEKSLSLQSDENDFSSDNNSQQKKELEQEQSQVDIQQLHMSLKQDSEESAEKSIGEEKSLENEEKKSNTEQAQLEEIKMQQQTTANQAINIQQLQINIQINITNEKNETRKENEKELVELILDEENSIKFQGFDEQFKDCDLCFEGEENSEFVVQNQKEVGESKNPFCQNKGTYTL